MAYLLIDPDTTLDYTVDWQDSLDSATISTSTWTVSPSGPTLSGGSHTDTTSTTFISGCTAGKVYQLTNRITTSGGTTEEKSIALRCQAQ